MATLIGLCLRVKLQRSLPRRFKVDVKIYPGTHGSEVEVNRQLNDKERVAAALENAQLVSVVTKCIASTDPIDEDDTAALQQTIASGVESINLGSNVSAESVDFGEDLII